MLSLLFLGRRAAARAKVESEGAPVAGPEGQGAAQAGPTDGERAAAAARSGESPARPPRRMWALVQYAPEVIVLAVSPSRSELERELAELNATWNHWELRTERQRYAIQAAPVLYPKPAGSAPARPMGSAPAG